MLMVEVDSSMLMAMSSMILKMAWEREERELILLQAKVRRFYPCS